MCHGVIDSRCTVRRAPDVQAVSKGRHGRHLEFGSCVSKWRMVQQRSTSGTATSSGNV